MQLKTSSICYGIFLMIISMFSIIFVIVTISIHHKNSRCKIVICSNNSTTSIHNQTFYLRKFTTLLLPIHLPKLDRVS